jgi:predicted enzyme related to lactoylglutathione lyase
MIKDRFNLATVILFALPILLLLTDCSPDLPKVPPITASHSGEFHPGKFVWYDLMSTDVPAVKKFYGELFGWEFDDGGDVNAVYTVIKHNGKSIGGIFALDKMKSRAENSQWISFFSVDNMESAIQYIKNNNGKIYTEPFELPDRGRVAVIVDPQDAVFALVSSSSGDTKDEEPIYNEWLWTELWTNDVDASISFYRGMIAYEKKVFMTQAETKYYVLRSEDRGRAGVVKITLEGVSPHWMPYIAVEDPSQIVSRVEELGGKILLGQEGIAGNTAAIIADPSGGVFTVHIWPLDENTFKEVKE